MLHLGTKKLAANTAWLLLEKVLRIFAALFVGILVSRYLGPEGFGQLSYAISVTTILAMLCHLGLEGQTVRRFVKFPDESQATLSTAMGMKLIATLAAFAVLLVLALSTETPGSDAFWLLLLAGGYIFAEPVLVVAFWFESQIQGKYATFAKSFGLLTVASLKLLFLFLGVGLLWFGAAFALEALLVACALVLLLNKYAPLSFSLRDFKMSLAKNMMSQGWMVMGGALFAAVYRKIDQSMLMWMASPTEVGVYAVAAQLSEVWEFVPVAIVSSLYPMLIRLKDEQPQRYRLRLQQTFDFLALLSIGLALVVTFIADDLMLLLYGEAYQASGSVLQIHIWSCVFVFFRALFSKWIHIEQVLIFSLVTQGVGAVSNVALNYWLIPIHGATGAAWATLLSYGSASFLCLVCHQKSRIVFWMMLKSLLVLIRFPWVVKGFYNVVHREK